MSKEIKEASDFLTSKLRTSPQIGIITGTGLGSVTENMSLDFRVPYKDIPHFPKSTTEGHKGTLACGSLSGKGILAMEGRFHLYEGYSPYEVTFPIRVMSFLGIRYLFIFSAAGGLNPRFTKGDLMVVTDHINLTGKNPLTGPNMDDFGPRFPDMSRVYDKELSGIAEEKALKRGIDLKKGVYVCVAGPSLETPAETRFLRSIGADAVGMSTVSEVIVGVHCGLKVMVITAITNVNIPDSMKETSIEEVITSANSASPSLAALWGDVIADLPD